MSIAIQSTKFLMLHDVLQLFKFCVSLFKTAAASPPPEPNQTINWRQNRRWRPPAHKRVSGLKNSPVFIELPTEIKKKPIQ